MDRGKKTYDPTSTGGDMHLRTVDVRTSAAVFAADPKLILVNQNISTPSIK